MIFSKNELSEIFNREISINIDGICINSKEVKAGDLFVALSGQRTDGHNFILEALNNGAVLAISEKDTGPQIIKVESSHEALLKLAKCNIEKSSAKYIGVTGSVGKTTTKNLIFHILSSQLKSCVYSNKKNFNSQIGLPMCAAEMPRNTKIGIFEMGMSNFGDIKKLIEIIPPSISVISQICETHLEFFDSVWDIAKAKSEIFEIPQEAAIIPADSAYADFFKQKAKDNCIKSIFTFGLPNSDARIIKYDFINDGFKVAAEILGEKIEYEMNSPLIVNSLPALLASHIASEISLQKLANSISSFKIPAGRGQAVLLKNKDMILIDDAYNGCPTSVKASIRSLGRYKNRRKIVVLGDLLELGKDAKQYHENISPTIDKFGIDSVFTCGPLSKSLFDNLRDCKKRAWCENSEELCEKVLEEIRSGDCILVKGSRSMKMDYIVDAIKNLDN
ncbi:MAG: UDP-N-acetylmuramoyl-tripeptide--D-alanyl-D-alanine ligase [Holosporaceae bacterium]|jgi:UDP-N-acetylmuramoyl-tripeptide--D-alanyl-D-alanine ligase|nr:UDP-N-acetylmuramoyl-tripeptide--D-alanyl-D-alanine ligase [Holosporaceae bacterium]